jgi:DNA gyrase subunit A
MHFIPGPDFPTGGIIIGAEGIVQAYGAGRGKLTLRGMAQIDEMNGNRHRIIITEIPYQLNKTSLIERIAELAREGRLDDVSDMRDESDRRGMRITIELKRGAQPKKVLNQLYKYTPLQGTYGVQMLALVDGEPRLLSLKKALQHFIEHRREVIRRRSTFELNKARDRAHILAGLLIALAHLDDVINTIRQSPDADVAKTRLMERFNLSERQAQAILDMQLRRLAALERQKIEDEQRQILERIAYLEDLLANPQKILGVIDEDITHLAEKYGDGRRTKITQEAGTELRIEDLVVDEPVLVSLTQRGYVKRMPASALRAQGRGSKGVAGHATREEDAVAMVIPARTLHTILFFTDKGKVYAEKAYQIPAADRTGRGIPIVNVLSLEAGETVTAAVAVREFDESHFAIMATRQGRIKRVALGEFAAVRPSGVIAINLDQGDRLGWVAASNGKNEIILVTQRGRALRFDETEVRAMGRSAAGVNAMRLSSGDALAGMDIVENDGYLLVLTERGYGKRTPLSEYPAKGRAGGGLLTINQDALEKVGLIVAAPVVQEGDDLTIMTGGGQVMRTAVKGIAVQGRSTRGVSVMKVGASSRVASVARVARADVEKVVKAAKAEAGDGNGNGNGSGEIESPGDLVE